MRVAVSAATGLDVGEGAEMKMPMLLLAASLGLIGAAPPEEVAPTPTPIPTIRPLLSAPTLANEVAAPPVFGAETSGLPQAVPEPPATIDPSFPVAGRRFGVSVEYIYWWLRDAPLAVPLATVRSAGSGDPSLPTELGSQLGRYDAFSGVRLGFNTWFDNDHRWGGEVSGFVLSERTSQAALSSDVTPGIDRILTNALTGQPLVVPVASPDVLVGNITAQTKIQFGGVEASVVSSVVHSSCWHVEVLAGYRYVNLREELAVAQQSQLAQGVVVDSGAFGLLANQDALLIGDRINTYNQFNGAQVGTRMEWACGPAYFELTGKVAVGDNNERVNAQGVSEVIPVAGPPGGPPAATGPGGLLVQPTNAGVSSRDRIAFVSEVGFNAGAQVTTNFRLFLGYSLLYWEGVIRPGNQIDPIINPAQIPLNAQFQAGPPNPARPTVPFRTSDFWAQGISFGFEWSF